jgi:hypothetical protein
MATYYIDPSIVSAGGQGIGTSGDPFGKTVGALQYALDEVGNSTVGAATGGDRFWILSSGEIDMNNATLSFATYTQPTDENPLHLIGYTSTTGDAGQFSINLGTAAFLDGTVDGLHVINAVLRGTNSTQMVDADRDCLFINCEFDGEDSANGWISGGLRTMCIRCYFHSLSTTASAGVRLGLGGHMQYCHVDDTSATSRTDYTVGVISASYNIVRPPAVGIAAMHAIGDGAWFEGNRIYGTGTASQIGMDVGFQECNGWVNNYVENCPTAYDMGSGHMALLAGNRWYNCTTGISGTVEGTSFDNSVLTASGYVNASGADFNLSGELLQQDAGWPTSYIGLTSHNTHAGIGSQLPYVPYYPRLKQS